MSWLGLSNGSSSSSSSSSSSRGSRAVSPLTVTCHFCGQRYGLRQAQAQTRTRKGKSVERSAGLPVISGSWSSFQCPSCESWNLRNPQTGEFVEDAQIYADPSLNAGPSTYRPRNGLQDKQDAVFCRACLTNQNLQVQLLAGYIPASLAVVEEERLMARLPAYQDSLDDRYPLVCPRCHGRVASVIEERNWKAKARTVGGWLKKSAIRVNTARPETRAKVLANHHIWLWRLKGIAWRTLYLATACLAPAASQNARTTTPLHTLWSSIYLSSKSAQAVLVLLFAFLSLFISFWNPAYREEVRRGDTARTVGKQRWLILQGILYLSRVWLAYQLVWHGTGLQLPVSLAISFVHLALLLFHHKLVYVTGPRRARLREPVSPVRSRQSTPSRTSTKRAASHLVRPAGQVSPRRAQAVFGKLSMGKTPPAPRILHRNGFRYNEADDVADDDHDDNEMQMDEVPADEDEADHTMLWQPEAEGGVRDIDMADLTEQSGTSSSNIHLRPAVFNPSDDTWNFASTSAVRGLERLFEQGVSLQDVHMAQTDVDDGARRIIPAQVAWASLTAGLAAMLAGGIYMIWKSKT